MTDLNARIGRYADASQRLVSQTGALMLEANSQIVNGTFDSAQWAKSARQLIDLAMTAGLELAPDMMPMCPPRSSGDLELSDFIEVDPDAESERLLSVAKPFVADGNPSYAIPDRSIVFVPSVLRTYATRFRVGVRGPNYSSGTYRGRIRLTRVRSGGVRVHESDLIIDL